MQTLSAMRDNQSQNGNIKLRRAPAQKEQQASKTKRVVDYVKYKCSNEWKSFVQSHRHEILAWACTKERLVRQPARRLSEVCKTRDWQVISLGIIALMALALLIILVVLAETYHLSSGTFLLDLLCISPLFIFVSFYMLDFAHCMDDVSYSFWFDACEWLDDTEPVICLTIGTMDQIYDAYRKMKYAIDDSMYSVTRFWWDVSDDQDKNNKWIADLVQILSLGKMHELKVESLKKIQDDIAHLSNEDGSSRKYIEQFDKAARSIHDLCLLWESELNGFKLCNADMFTKGNMIEIGKKIGVDILIDAYVRGVPVEDIVA